VLKRSLSKHCSSLIESEGRVERAGVVSESKATCDPTFHQQAYDFVMDTTLISYPNENAVHEFMR
jgi:hypothetical protein